jgi:MoaD family protein
MTLRGERPAEEAKRIETRYFAILRELSGRSGETMETRAATAHDLFEELKHRHGWPGTRQAFRVAVNNELREWSAPLKHGDVVSILPPVAGG